MVFASVTIDYALCSDKWIVIPGPKPFKHVSTSINYYWATSTDDQIFICERPCKNWKQINGGLKQVDVSDMEVWGVNSGNAIYKRPADGSGSWIHVKGVLTHVSASGNGYIWGVNANDDIYICKKPCNGGWKHIPGKLKQIDGGEEYVFGSNAALDVYRRSVDGSGQWYGIPGGRKMKYVSVGAGEVFGVDKEGDIFRCTLPCEKGNWEKVAESCFMLGQVEATVGEIVGSAQGSVVMKKEV